MSIKKDRVDRLEKVNMYNRIQYLSMFVGKVSKMLVEEKKEYFEGFSPEYIRCYADNDNLISGKEYEIKFIDYYRDGMIVKIIKELE